jgi:hypothetical protein
MVHRDIVEMLAAALLGGLLMAAGAVFLLLTRGALGF